MEVSLNWLNELVDLKDIDVKQIAHEKSKRLKN